MVEPARVCAISCVVEGKLTVISARVIYRLGAFKLCDSRGLRSPTVCYPLTASALELFPTHHTTRGRACLLPFTLAMRFVHAMWRCDMPLAEYKHGRVGTLCSVSTVRQDTAASDSGLRRVLLDDLRPNLNKEVANTSAHTLDANNPTP